MTLLIDQLNINTHDKYQYFFFLFSPVIHPVCLYLAYNYSFIELLLGLGLL